MHLQLSQSLGATIHWCRLCSPTYVTAGRGALDVKVGAVGLLEAANALLESGYSPRRTLLLAFGHDEEVGGTAGAAHIAGEALV